MYMVVTRYGPIYKKCPGNLTPGTYQGVCRPGEDGGWCLISHPQLIARDCPCSRPSQTRKTRLQLAPHGTGLKTPWQ